MIFKQFIGNECYLLDEEFMMIQAKQLDPEVATENQVFVPVRVAASMTNFNDLCNHIYSIPEVFIKN